MKIRLALCATALAVLAACGGGGGTDPAPVVPPASIDTTRLVVFGDSLSDGGAYALGNSLILQGQGIPRAAADLVGKFTNSPGAIWVEVLGQRLGVAVTPERYEVGAASPVAATNRVNTGASATNYAQGGSRVSRAPGVGCNPNPAGACTAQAAVPVSVQIDRALAKGNFTAGDLVVIWAGANDVFFQATLASNEITATSQRLGRAMTSAETEALIRGKYGPEMVQAALDAAAQVRRVVAAGARRVVVMTIPNAALSPLGAQGGASSQALFTALSGAFNDALKTEFATPTSGVLLFDAGALSAGWYANPASGGFVNVQAPVCNVPAALGSSSSFCFVTGPTPGPSNPFLRALPAGVTPDNSLFADGVHPSLRAHNLFGTALYDTLKARAWVR